jgi:signal peptidase I
LLVGVAAAMGAVALRRQFAVVLVRGTSMQPALKPGDRILVRRGGREPQVNDVVIFPDPSLPVTGSWVVKRVAAVAGDPVPPGVPGAEVGAALVPPRVLAVIGDNRAASRDSRHWGLLPEDVVLGRAVRTLHATRRNPAGQSEESDHVAHIEWRDSTGKVTTTVAAQTTGFE